MKISWAGAWDRATRQQLVVGALPMLAAASVATFAPPLPSASAASLAERLRARDALQLKKQIFNVPPQEAVYPAWLDGTWRVQSTFRGFEFPSAGLPKESVMAEPTIPGFQKCSIALTSDVGKDVQYLTRFIPRKPGVPDVGVVEDRAFSLASSINGHLGYRAVERVIYEPGSNPNRLSIVFRSALTRNAERIELFCNAREAEQVRDDVFICSEYLRQVTFSASTTPGVARQVSGEYAHFFTYRQLDSEHVKCNILTAVYLEPMQQDALFMRAPTNPVVVYSHDLQMQRLASDAEADEFMARVAGARPPPSAVFPGIK
jgi:hypothetical protein